MPANISGYQYLREAILITTADPSVLNKAVTKILYPEIARRYGTTALRVERCIRSAIETAWDRASPETLPKYFGCTVSSQRGKPSNAEFIALLADCLLYTSSPKQCHLYYLLFHYLFSYRIHELDTSLELPMP